MKNIRIILRDKICNGENFQFIKFGDGEFLCMMGSIGHNCDLHPYSRDLGEKLSQAYQYLAPLESAYIAEWREDKFEGFTRELNSKLPCSPQYVPYEALLSNNLDSELYHLYKGVKDSRRKKIFIGNKRMRGIIRLLDIDNFIEIPEINCFAKYDSILNALKPLNDTNNIFLFSAGMPAKCLIHELVSINLF